MLKPNPTVASMAAYALPDISAAEGVEAIVLAQNEHAFAPSAAVQQAVSEAIASGQLYPETDWDDLREAIAAVHGLDAGRIVCGAGTHHLAQVAHKQITIFGHQHTIAAVHGLDAGRIVCGAGSMELMSSLMLAYLSPGDRMLMTEYGYLFMRNLSKLVGASVDLAAEIDYRVDVDGLLAQLQPDTRLVFIVNPGNPSGTVIHNDEIRRLRAGLPDDVLLLVDEAYAEFVEPDFHSPLFDLAETSNTVITRTFSKIYGLAGLRVGWGYFPVEVRDELRKVINPSSVSSVSQAAARAAMNDQAHAAEARQMIAEQRSFLSQSIAGLGLTVVPSYTNFILVDFESVEQAASAFEFLRQHGLVVRPMGGYGLPGCLRITIGTAVQMQSTASVLASWKEGIDG